MLFVAIPPVACTYMLRVLDSEGPLAQLIKIYDERPLIMLNILWFLHVDVTFYIISLVQVRIQMRDSYLVPDKALINRILFIAGEYVAYRSILDSCASFSGALLVHASNSGSFERPADRKHNSFSHLVRTADTLVL
jgi:hypothetical protein